jgi:hypothetical protein
MSLVKALNAANTQAAINEIKLDLQERIFEAREALTAARETQTASLERIRDLEQQIVQLKEWEADKQRYELKQVAPGAFVYALKESMKGAEPEHWLCANCYQQRRKSILQKIAGSQTQTLLSIPTQYECAACKAKIAL